MPTTMLAELLYPPFQYGIAPLHYAASLGDTACLEHLLSTPGIDVNLKDKVSLHTDSFINYLWCSLKYLCISN